MLSIGLRKQYCYFCLFLKNRSVTDPVIIYCCKGWSHLCYAIWSVRSLKRFNYKAIEVIVANEVEKSFFVSHCPGVVCSVLDADSKDYPAFSYKPFVLQRYIKEIGIHYVDRDIVICDADILWKNDPKLLFNRFENMNWVHKITAINPSDYERNLNEVREADIGLITLLNYKNKFDIEIYPNYRVNAGLFMLPEKSFGSVINNWMDKIYSLSANEMKMSEALLSLTYAEMNINPVCDEKDIKHYGVEIFSSSLNTSSFVVANKDLKEDQYTGYETAQHYYGDQRRLMFKHAKEMGFDYDNLSRVANFDLIKKQLKSIPKIPKKVLSRVKRIFKEVV